MCIEAKQIKCPGDAVAKLSGFGSEHSCWEHYVENVESTDVCNSKVTKVCANFSARSSSTHLGCRGSEVCKISGESRD